MAIQSFAEYAEAASISLVDGELTQGEFSSTYTNWLVQVVAPEFLNGADIGNWTISINQNDSGAPYFSSADGLTAEELAELNEAFAALFDAGISIDVITGRTTKERWYSDLAEQTDTDTNPYVIELTGDQTTAGTDGTASSDGADGANAYRVSLGGSPPSYNYFASVAGGDGTDGGDGADAVTLDEPVTPYTSIHVVSTGGGENAILGGNGADGGDGGDGGNGNATGNYAGNLPGADGGDGGAGGHAIVNGAVNLVYITGDTNLTILGGTIGDGGAGGAGGTGATSGDIGGTGGDGGDGTVAGTDGTDTGTKVGGTGGLGGAGGLRVSAFSDRVDVDASAFTGVLTISGSDFNDTFIAGSGGSFFYATEGSDSYAAGSGADWFIFTSAAQSDGSVFTDSISGFDFANDNLDFTAIATSLVLANSCDTLEVDLDNDTVIDMVLDIDGLGAFVSGGGSLGDLLVA